VKFIFLKEWYVIRVLTTKILLKRRRCEKEFLYLLYWFLKKPSAAIIVLIRDSIFYSISNGCCGVNQSSNPSYCPFPRLHFSTTQNTTPCPLNWISYDTNKLQHCPIFLFLVVKHFLKPDTDHSPRPRFKLIDHNCLGLLTKWFLAS